MLRHSGKCVKEERLYSEKETVFKNGRSMNIIPLSGLFCMHKRTKVFCQQADGSRKKTYIQNRKQMIKETDNNERCRKKAD